MSRDFQVNEEVKDITIIGAGPSGLFTAFQAGMYEASVRIIDSMPEAGGQLTALYPEKYIFDAPGFAKITAKELAGNLFEQASQFGAEFCLDETVMDIVQPMRDRPEGLSLQLNESGGGIRPALSEVEGWGGNSFEIVTDKGHYLSKTVIIAAGLGAFKPRSVGLPEIERYEEKGVYYIVREKEFFNGKDVVIVGG